jgi:NAD(P)-dependent dehydrogenase (short-subunit alcohol dehydrogenase family)
VLSPSGRVVMISGASRGIGAAIARRLTDDGYALSLGLRGQPAAPARANALVTPYEARDRDAGKRWVAATLERFGRIDAVVNNAGISPMVALDEPGEDETALDAMWEINVKAPLRVIRAALPHLKASGSGRVVNVVSLSGKRVKSRNTGYTMSKFALIALTHAVRQIGWEHGIRATALCPGMVDTDMTANVTLLPRHEMIPPAALAELVATVLRLPNNAAVAELLVNCRLEDML